MQGAAALGAQRPVGVFRGRPVKLRGGLKAPHTFQVALLVVN